MPHAQEEIQPAGRSDVPLDGGPVSEVLVRGALRVEGQALLRSLATRAGAPYDTEKVRSDIRTLYATGNFENVGVERDGEGRVIFLVLERPGLRQWKFDPSGDVLDDEEVKTAVTLKDGEILRRGAVEDNVEILRGLYRDKGYFLAVITPEVIKLDDGKNRVDVVFHAEPREMVRIRDIHMPGASREETEEILDNLALTREGFWTWLVREQGQFKESSLEHDLQWIHAFYLERGHAEIAVGEPAVSVTPDMKSLRVEIPVKPGPVYTFGKVTFSGDAGIPPEDMVAAAQVTEGATFSSSVMRKAVFRLQTRLGDDGYAFAEVRPRTSLDRESRRVDVEFVVDKGDRVRIGRIEVRGNETTRDRVVRREMRVDEGDLYSGTSYNKSQRAVRNLGYFEDVKFDLTRRPDSDLVDVDVSVRESQMGTLSAGGGYSSAEGIVGQLSLSHRNLLGYGYQFSLDANMGTSRESYSFTFNNPRLFDSEIYLGGDLYKSFSDLSEYNKAAVGWTLRTGTNLTDDWKVRVSYGWDSSEVIGICTYEDYVAGLCDDPASLAVQESEGKTITSSLTPALIYDSRDNPWEAREGINGKASVKWAGGLLGYDAAYLKYDLDVKKYYGLPWSTVFTWHGRIGYAQGLEGKDLPIFERYALGGINTLRGFDSRSVGPKDPGVVDKVNGGYLREPTGEVIGGDKYFVGNLEYVFPLIPEAKFNGVIFFDFGNAWDLGEAYFSTHLRTSVGAGFRWLSPMGPLRLEYGYNLEPEEGEGRAQWEFSIGGFF
jgi:outer membrane protein insertion porin family